MPIKQTEHRRKNGGLKPKSPNNPNPDPNSKRSKNVRLVDSNHLSYLLANTKEQREDWRLTKQLLVNVIQQEHL